MTEPIIKIESGQKIPETSVHIKSEGGIDAISTTDYFKGRRVVMFAVPGAFTSTCSAKHVPSFLQMQQNSARQALTRLRACR